MKGIKLTAEVAEIRALKHFGKNSDFPVQTVIVNRGTYPYEIKFAGDDGIAMCEKLGVGDQAEFECTLGCREWKKPDMDESKYFYSLECDVVLVTTKAGQKEPVVNPQPVGVGDADIPF